MSAIGTMTTGVGVVSTFNMTFVPQYIAYVAATQLTGLKVTVLGDGVITDLDAAGLSAVYNIRSYGQVANGYMIPVADGLIPSKNVEITATNSAAQTPILYAIALQKGTAYIQCLRQTALANSGIQLQKFAYIAIPAIAATDILNITYVDGLVQNLASAELAFIAQLNESASLNVIDNVEGFIDLVQFTPSANRTVYVVRYSGKDLMQGVS